MTLDALPLFATDAELAKAILGKRAKEWPRVVALYEAKGLPPINTLMCGRFVPAVLKFFDHLEGVTNSAPVASCDGKEDALAWNKRKTRRPASNGGREQMAAKSRSGARAPPR
jgi:hypothetical protein